MDSVANGSFDRFLLHRGSTFIGHASLKAAVRINGGIGTGLIALGLAFVVASFFAGDPGIAAGASGPVVGGAINLAMALSWNKRAKQLEKADTRLSPEATEFMHRLMRAAFGWRYKWMFWDNGQGSYIGRGRLRHRIRELKYGTYQDQPQKPADQFLNPQVFQLIESASLQYNRVYGLLTSVNYSPNSLVGKLKPSLMQAIEEAMATVLHHAAMLDKFPEGNASAAKIIENHTEALREAGDRVESLVSRDVESSIESVSETSALEAVLEDLRLSDQAQKELDSEQTVQINGPHS
jgi:hypothetical protein